MKSPFSVWETPKASKGFTLLEMMLSIGVFLLLVASAFSIVGATTELMTEVSETQERSLLRQRFITACRNSFEAATSKSSLEFEYFDRGGSVQDTYLTLTKAPGAFDFGSNREDHITHVVLASEIRSGSLVFSLVIDRKCELEVTSLPLRSTHCEICRQPPLRNRRINWNISGSKGRTMM